MPGVFLRAIGARLRLSGPARHFELGTARLQSRIDQPVFDILHRGDPFFWAIDDIKIGGGPIWGHT
jgi:hypothetical protein